MSLPKNQDPIKTTLTSPTDNGEPKSSCAILTGAGRSAVAVIGVCGPAAADAIDHGFAARTRGPFEAGQIRFGHWDGEAIVVTPLNDESFEIHCHGGPLAAARIVEDLCRAGIQAVQQHDWNVDDRPLVIREAQLILSRCLTARTAAIALDQARGALLRWCQTRLEELHSANEPSLIERCRSEIGTVAGRGQLGTRLADPFRVVLAGPPNVGKSSLVNAIVGYDRSITMDVAGTTRDVLHADTVIDGLPIRLSDTAGMRDSAEPIEKQGIEFAKKAAADADLVVVVSDPDSAFDAELSFGQSISVLNKADLIKDASPTAGQATRTVATTGEGVPELMQAIAAALGDSFPKPGEPVPLTPRQVDRLRKAASSDKVTEMIEHLERLISG